MIETQYIVVFFYFSHKIWYVRHSALSVIIYAKRGKNGVRRRLWTRFTVYYYASPLLGTLTFATLLRIMLLFARGVRDGAERRRAFELLPVGQKVLAQQAKTAAVCGARCSGACARAERPARLPQRGAEACGGKRCGAYARATLNFCPRQNVASGRRALGHKKAPCATQRASLFGALRRYSVKIEEGAFPPLSWGRQTP